MSLHGRVEEVDQAVERIRSEIDRCSASDPELAAGFATGESLASVQASIDRAMATVEVLDGHLRDLGRSF